MKKGPWLVRVYSGVLLPSYPSYVGSIIKHYKDPYYTISTVESKAFFFFRGSIGSAVRSGVFVFFVFF